MTKHAHTPTPYRVESDGRGPYIVAKNQGRVATIGCQSFKANGGREDWTTARFIARACSAHDELVEALKALVKATEDYQHNRCGSVEYWTSPAMQIARGTLAKAEGATNA
jgi:hypothetical protein